LLSGARYKINNLGSRNIAVITLGLFVDKALKISSIIYSRLLQEGTVSYRDY